MNKSILILMAAMLPATAALAQDAAQGFLFSSSNNLTTAHRRETDR